MNTLNQLLTIVIPVKNEEINLPGCLENVKSFEHVVIVDSGSVDRTLDIAQQFDREVVQFKWDGKFPKKRNWFLRNYTFKTPWCLFLDADERITEKWLCEAEKVLAEALDSSIDAFICYYDNWFMGRVLRHGDAMRKTAILRIGAGEYERIEENAWSKLDMEIHEHLVVKGNTEKIVARLEHYDKRSLESHWKKHEQYAAWECNRYFALLDQKGSISTSTQLTKRQKIKYGLIKRWFFPWLYFCVSYFCKCGFLDGWAGLRFALLKVKYFSFVRDKISKSKLDHFSSCNMKNE